MRNKLQLLRATGAITAIAFLAYVLIGNFYPRMLIGIERLPIIGSWSDLALVILFGIPVVGAAYSRFLWSQTSFPQSDRRRLKLEERTCSMM